MIKVKAGKAKDGSQLIVHFPHRVITAPGRRTLKITGDEVAEVDENQLFVRKRLRVGDLVIVKVEEIELEVEEVAGDKPKKKSKKDKAKGND